MMTQEEINALSSKDKLTLLHRITVAINAPRPQIAEDGRNAIAAMERVTGHAFDMSPRRDLESFWEKAIIAEYLHGKGYSEAQIGTTMMRDHSTVNWMRRRMREIEGVRSQYPEVFRLKVRFYNEIQNEKSYE